MGVDATMSSFLHGDRESAGGLGDTRLNEGSAAEDQSAVFATLSALTSS